MVTQNNNHLKHSILGICNPLLDIEATVDTELLERYNLKANDAILAGEEHLPLYKELIEKYKVSYMAGGAAQNSCRGAQYLLPPNAVTFIGCIGKDEFGSELKKAAQKAGIRALYLEEETPTGTCAVLLTGQSRSLVANLSAANDYKADHIRHPDIWREVETSKYFYISGFFLTVSPDTIQYVAHHCAATNRMFTMNLSAPFLCTLFQGDMDQASPYWDIVFGNESEAAAYADAHNINTHDLATIAKKIVLLSKKNMSRPRIVVFTHGCEPTVVAWPKNFIQPEHGTTDENRVEVQYFSPILIPKENIVDTNGAGDAFVGGFLAQLAKEGAKKASSPNPGNELEDISSLERCVRCGHWLASEVVQRSGATFPEESCDIEF